jgi:hypothetical protein
MDIREVDSERDKKSGIQVNIVFEYDGKMDWTNYYYKDGELKRREE